MQFLFAELSASDHNDSKIPLVVLFGYGFVSLMKCVILQPSFIPWRGYFHQIHKSDIFVLLDCVQYDKRGWRNRNRIKTSQGAQWLTIPVNTTGTYQGLLICDISIAQDQSWRRKHFASIEHNYRKAPYWKKYAVLVEEIYALPGDRLVDITCPSTEMIARHLGSSNTRFLRSSSLEAKGKKTDRLLDILNKVGATHYISGPSARNYIEEEKFDAAGITLEYMTYNYPEYPQMHGPFDAQVSILDLLFNLGPEAPQYIWGSHTI